MIDISMAHADLTYAFHSDTVEHYGYADEYYSLDLTDENQALYAIRKWVVTDHMRDYYLKAEYQIKEAMRYCITEGRYMGDYWLSGIDGLRVDDNDEERMERWILNMRAFFLLLWKELFPNDPFHEADITQYRQRVDRNFVHFPHMPETWGEPEYKPWDVEVGNPYAPYKP